MKQLFIDGQLIDIDDNFQIIRNYQSPFFKDVNTLKNNTTYATLLPSTINNMSFLSIVIVKTLFLIFLMFIIKRHI